MNLIWAIDQSNTSMSDSSTMNLKTQ
jgi:hypothetical protein